MGLKLEVVKANEGDCLLLHYGDGDTPALTLIDGGTPIAYGEYLEKRLRQLREDLVGDGEPLPLELVMVSHIDQDHIGGVRKLLEAIESATDKHTDLPYEVGQLWHNGFRQLTGADEKSVEEAEKASLDAVPEAGAIVAAAKEGASTSTLATTLGIPRNDEGELVLAGAKLELDGGLELTVIGPTEKQVDDLRDEWAKEVGLDPDELVPASLQETVSNLSSLIVVAEYDGKRILLTGDAVAEDILAGLEKHGFLKKEPARFDVFKLPHHGDDGSVSEELFERVTARHYVASGDGKNANPSLKTLRMLAAARGDDEYDVWLTFREGKLGLTKNLKTFEAEQREADRNSTMHYPRKGAVSMTIDLD